MRPTAYLFGAEPSGPWTVQDRGLAEALQAYEDGLCPGCGHSRDKAWDPRSEGEYEAEVHVCEGCAAKSRKEKDAAEHAGRYVMVARLPEQTSVEVSPAADGA